MCKIRLDYEKEIKFHNKINKRKRKIPLKQKKVFFYLQSSNYK